MDSFLRLRGVRTNNLKNIDVDIPLKEFTVVTGPSGSGKSSLAFDTLYAEGQRRYVESLSTYVRQFLEKMPRPDLDSVENISPAIALEQKNHINNSRDTVATMSEVYDYLRLFFGRIGTLHCLKCQKPVSKDTPLSIAQAIGQYPDGSRFYVLAPLDQVQWSDKSWKLTRDGLVAQGYERLLINGEVIDLPSLKKSPLPKKSKASLPDIFLVIDRLSRPDNPSEDGRLLEAIEQALTQGNGKMTIATPPSKDQWQMDHFSEKFACCGVEYRTPDPQMLSFNSPLGACDNCSGFGFTLEFSESKVVPDKKKSLRAGAIDPFTKPAYGHAQAALLRYCEKNQIPLDKRYEDLSAPDLEKLWKGVSGTKGWFNGIHSFFEMLKEMKYKMHVRIFIRRYQDTVLCPICLGARLKAESLSIRIGQSNIADVLSMTISQALEWCDSLSLAEDKAQASKDVLRQIRDRLYFMHAVGVGYLTLDRLGKTLSGGECQRIYLSSQLGNKLCSTLYVLDEPSIGLHAADTSKLISLLRELKNLGNTVVVVEHDMDIIQSADYILEMGPAAGHKGGQLVGAGPLKEVLGQSAASDKPFGLTAQYLRGDKKSDGLYRGRPYPKDIIKLTGACENNLKNVTLEIPLKRLVCVTGLSGSGKTSLIHRTLYNALHRLFHREVVPVGRFQRLYGADLIDDVALLDQKSIGRNSRSNPATYLKLYDDVRKIYANQSLSLRRGYTPQYFSFNVDGGRCPVCKGEGQVTIDMHFMSDVTLPCEECGGKRFTKEVLEVEFKGKNISQLLETTIDECIDLFREYPALSYKLQLLRQVGLGYLQLGQSGATLSGGESQRLKVASVLTDTKKTNVLYIFDEPTTGLHIDDVKRLIMVMQGLVDSGNSILVIEHNLDFIAAADHIIDLGPGAGAQGGEIIATGTPEQIMAIPQSLTGRFLKQTTRYL